LYLDTRVILDSFQKSGLDTKDNLDLDLDWSRLSRPPTLVFKLYERQTRYEKLMSYLFNGQHIRRFCSVEAKPAGVVARSKKMVVDTQRSRNATSPVSQNLKVDNIGKSRKETFVNRHEQAVHKSVKCDNYIISCCCCHVCCLWKYSKDWCLCKKVNCIVKH
jgi:hypothetical protein